MSTHWRRQHKSTKEGLDLLQITTGVYAQHYASCIGPALPTCIHPSTSFSLSTKKDAVRALRESTCMTSNIRVTMALQLKGGKQSTWIL
jgi:hypothetical protein